MKKITSFILLFFLVIFGLSTPLDAFASKYGECGYGDGSYNENCVSSDDSSSGSTSGGSSSTSGDSSVCTKQAPGNEAPWLYAAVAKSGTEIEIYFTDAQDPYDHYALEFGTSSGNYQFGSTDIGGKGTRTYTVGSLRPNTTYYFRVRAGNGCATGNWSNELAASTSGLFSVFSTDSLDTQLVDVTSRTSQRDGGTGTGLDADGNELADGDEDTAIVEQVGVNVKIKVLDENKQAVLGASVTLHSTPRETTTDEDGIALFDNVEPGEHRVVVAYNDQTGEQKINIPDDPDVDEIDFTIQIKTTSPFLNPWVMGVVGTLSAGFVIVSILFLRARSRR